MTGQGGGEGGRVGLVRGDAEAAAGVGALLAEGGAALGAGGGVVAGGAELLDAPGGGDVAPLAYIFGEEAEDRAGGVEPQVLAHMGVAVAQAEAAQEGGGAHAAGGQEEGAGLDPESLNVSVEITTTGCR